MKTKAWRTARQLERKRRRERKNREHKTEPRHAMFVRMHRKFERPQTTLPWYKRHNASLTTRRNMIVGPLGALEWLYQGRQVHERQRVRQKTG